MKSILVYCGSNKGSDPAYSDAAALVGKTLAERGIRLVYGGGSVGLMGIVADAALKHGGDVLGIIPNFIDEWEVGHKNLPKMVKVETMHERKALMELETDAVVVLPGGYGSYDEMFEMLAWSQLKLHNKPIGMLNVSGFYNLLLKFLDHSVTQGFLKEENKNLLLVSEDFDDLLQKMEAQSPEDQKTNIYY